MGTIEIVESSARVESPLFIYILWNLVSSQVYRYCFEARGVTILEHNETKGAGACGLFLFIFYTTRLQNVV